MTHDPLCPMSPDPDPAYCCFDCDGYECECVLIAKVRADERNRKGTCWREADGSEIPAGAIRVYREAGWFWEMP